MTPLQYFRLFAPEFATTSDVDVEGWITIAESFVNVGCLETEPANMARACYAAHLLWLTANQANGGGGSGPIRSEKEGDLSRTYNGVSGDDSWLGQSPYGRLYINATLPCFGAGIMTRVSNGSTCI